MDAVPICLDCTDVDEMVETVVRLAPAFGGINLEDIAAPRCFEVERRLQELLDIPVFHDDQHGTAIVVLAALQNAAKVTGKELADLRVVISGAGAAGVAITKILLDAGVGDVVVADTRGTDPPRPGRPDRRQALGWRDDQPPRAAPARSRTALAGADVFIGVSAGRCPSQPIASHGAEASIVFALANPDPEVHPTIARRYAAVVATGRSDFPNQINNVLAFPGIFRGALDVRASQHHRGDEAGGGRGHRQRRPAGRAEAGLHRAEPVQPPGGRRGRRPGGRGGPRRRRREDLRRCSLSARLRRIRPIRCLGWSSGSGPSRCERPGWVPVRVRAASVNHHDVWSLRGVGLPADRLPMILGCDAAGIDPDGREVIVHSVISSADYADETMDPDRSLLSERHQGTFADVVVVPARNLVPKPPELSMAQAACLPTAWLTAYRMLATRSALRAGDTVLIQGAGGGVATAAIMLARVMGLRVWVTSRDDGKGARAVELGAHEAFASGARLPDRVDAVIESVGAATWSHSLKALRPGGQIIVTGATSGANPPADLQRVFFRQLSGHRLHHGHPRGAAPADLALPSHRAAPPDRARAAAWSAPPRRSPRSRPARCSARSCSPADSHRPFRRR